MEPDWSWVVTVASIDSGDQISNIRIVSQRFVTGDAGYLLGVYNEPDALPVQLSRVAANGS
jgi:hypothetical protein